jgi:hypothetical protein
VASDRLGRGVQQVGERSGGDAQRRAGAEAQGQVLDRPSATGVASLRVKRPPPAPRSTGNSRETAAD